jgi:hypothetical protein
MHPLERKCRFTNKFFAMDIRLSTCGWGRKNCLGALPSVSLGKQRIAKRRC